MGKPKALVSFCGTPLVCRGLKRLGGIADQLIVTSNEPESLTFLCVEVTGDRLEVFGDIYDTRGALNGLYTALYYAQNPYVAVVACDMVFPSAELLKEEQLALINSNADAAVPKTSHGYEPFHAVYRRETCLPLVHEALKAGETRATGWYDKATIIEFSSQDVLDADPRGGSFVNVNTPEELEHIEQRVANGEMTMICGDEDSFVPYDKRDYSCGYQKP